MPSGHIGPVRSLTSYDPTTLASDGGEASSAPTAASRSGKGRASLSASDDEGSKPHNVQRKAADWESDEDEWDAWDDGAATGPSRRSTDERPGVGGGGRSSRSSDDDDDERAMQHEMKTLALTECDGHVASEKELRKKLYWRDAMVTGIFVLLWCVPGSEARMQGRALTLSYLTWLGGASGTCSRRSSRSVLDYCLPFNKQRGLTPWVQPALPPFCSQLYNKWVFGPSYFGFPFPMFMTFCQM